MTFRNRIAGLLALTSTLAAWPALAAPPRELAHLVEADGTRLVVQGPGVADFVPQMPVWILERDAAGKPGLLLAEGHVRWVQGDRAVVEIAEKDAARVRQGAIVEPRFLAEARLYRVGLPAEQGVAGAIDKKPAEPAVRVRHRVPESVQWGQNLWLEALLEGPADKLAVLYRLGGIGPYTELAMANKGDNLFGVEVPVGQTNPNIRQLQYYLVATATAGATRLPVQGNPAEPKHVTIESVPEPTTEQLVQHGPVDRGSHRKPLEITAEVNKRFVKPTLMYRARGSGAYLRLPLHQSGPETWSAEIPARDVVTPGLAYYITVVDEKGVVRDGFASNRNPQTVTVLQPQILSAEENRNQLTFAWQRADFGSPDDRYQEFEVGLERLFFGFLIARMNGGYLAGRAMRGHVVNGGPETPVFHDISMKRGRVGLAIHMGDYFSISTELAMAIATNAGVGYRVGLRVGDEQVATIDGMIEQVWDLKTDAKFVDVYRGVLAIPVNETWRLQGSAVFESVLRASPQDKALRLLAGIEHDMGEHIVASVHGGVASGPDNAQGPDVGAAVRLKF